MHRKPLFVVENSNILMFKNVISNGTKKESVDDLDLIALLSANAFEPLKSLAK